MKNKTSFIQLMNLITSNEVMKNKFIQSEDAFFDLYSIEDEDRELIRNAKDINLLSARITQDISTLSLPGKVSVRKEYDNTPSLMLLNELVGNINLRNNFILNEVKNGVEYRDLAFSTFDIKGELQESFSSLIDNDLADVDDALDKICASIKEEIKYVKRIDMNK